MKHFNILVLFTAGLILASCSKENIQYTEASFVLTDSNKNTIAGQLPNPKFDHSEKGIYHGIIASGENVSRGKIWVNINNDGQYKAFVELVGGQHISYSLQKDHSNISEQQYAFKSEGSWFVIDLSDYNNPIFRDVFIAGQPYFASAAKGTDSRMPFSFTGIFRETVAGTTFVGTWNLISTGTPAPEGFGYETISSAVVTFNSNMYTDTSMEQFNYPCVGNPSFTPQMGDVAGNSNAVIAHTQTSNFNGTTSWDLGTGNGSYFDSSCSAVGFGTFTWTSPVSGTTRNGLIVID